jgi:glutaredoxin
MNNDPSTMISQAHQPHAEVVVYWRPGCPFCSSLRSALASSRLPIREVNIWEDDEGAAVVRSVARGNETVPTVIVGSTGLVNPSLRQVVDAVRLELPHLVDHS